MSPDSRPLRVVAISQDVPVLHEIGWVLEAVGYDVSASNDAAADALWRRYSAADIVIVDGRGVLEPSADIFALSSNNPTYRIFLYDPSKQVDFAAWYAAGAHDGLRTPLSRGELLARLRTGARYLEFERRRERSSSRSRLPGLVTRRGLLRKLGQGADNSATARQQRTVLANSIDWYKGIVHDCGKSAGRYLVGAATRSIRRAVGNTAVTAYLGEGKFATLLVGQSMADARAIAESIAGDFARRESHHEAVPRPTMTCALIPWTVERKVDRFISDVLESLHLAESAGGNHISEHGEFEKEFGAWREEMSAGNPFQNVIAQDIMEPFPALLTHGGEQPELAAALRRSGVGVLPLVDRDGSMVGIAEEKDSTVEPLYGQSGDSTADRVVKPETISHDATFPEIYEAFSARGCTTLVVTADNRPLGYITCDSFLSMIDPIDTETYADTDKSVDELAYLVVPSTTGTTAVGV